MRGKRAALSAELDAQLQRLIGATVTFEAPRVLLLTVGIIVAFDAGYAAVGLIMTSSYYLSDILQSLVMLTTAIGLRRGLIAERHAPAALMVAVVANNMATTYQATLVGEGALGIVALLLAVAGAVALSWRPFLLGALVCTSFTGFVLYRSMPDIWVTWYITMLTATAVSAMVLHGRRRSMLKLAEAQLTIEEMATLDQLTGLLNRHGFNEQVGLLVGQARRNAQPVFAVFIDVTGLKHVNNEYGHGAGDLVLVRVAAAVREHARAGELLCRWGGDEFLIVGIGERPAAEVLERRLVAAIDGRGLERIWTPALWVGTAEGTASLQMVEQVVMMADHHMLSRREAHTNPLGIRTPAND